MLISSDVVHPYDEGTDGFGAKGSGSSWRSWTNSIGEESILVSDLVFE